MIESADVNNLIHRLDEFEISSESLTCEAEEVSLHVTRPRDKTKLLCQNICSISGNFDGLLTLLSRVNLDFDFLILTECWLRVCHQSPPMLDGYNVYHTTDNFNKNDGVVVYANKSLLCSVLEPVFPETNCLVIKISTHTAIIAIYRPYCFKRNVPLFLSSLDVVLKDLAAFTNIILVGDININIAPDSTEEHFENYLNLLAMHGMLPTHTLPTRRTSCLDHFIIKTKKLNSTFVLHSSITDHEAIILCIDVKQARRAPAIISKIDYTTLDDTMASLNLNPVLTATDPNIAANLLVNLLAQALVSNTKLLRLPRRARTIKPWITPGLLRCIRNRDLMHKKLKIFPNDAILSTTYRRYRNFCNDILKKVKREYQRKEIQDAGTNSKKIWNVIKSNTNMNKSKDSAINLLNMSSTLSKSVNDVNEYFVNIGKSLADKIKMSANVHRTPSISNSHMPHSFALFDTDEVEVENIILSLKSNCAMGWDGIPTMFLKIYKDQLVPSITHVCKLSLSTGIFPDAFKKAVVKPIFKSGNRDCVSNYRPISILPSMSKVLEKIMNKRLIKYLEINNLLSPQQYGFRANKSTSDAVHDLTECIVSNLDGGRKCLSIFLDLAKAFDTVSIPLLLDKLQRLGIRGLPLDLFASYLSQRHQIVKIENHASDDLLLSYGVPQGSILGPSLFLVFINDLCNIQLINGQIVSFADDTALIFYANSIKELYQNAQTGLDLVLGWLGKNLLTINVEKTKYMLFSIRNGPSVEGCFNLTAHTCNSITTQSCFCSNLENVSTIKYLGINLDNNLNFQTHIKQLSGRMRKLIFIFKTLRHIAEQRLILTVYYALGQSILNYCILIWGGTHKSTLKKLEVAQRAVLKVATFRPFLYPTAKLYEECNVLTVRQLFIASTILKKHSELTYDPAFSLNKRRNDLVCPSKLFRTAFVRRFFIFLGSYLYNKCNAKSKIYPLNKYQCKKSITKWLLSLNYDETEKLLEIIS